MYVCTGFALNFTLHAVQIGYMVVGYCLIGYILLFWKTQFFYVKDDTFVLSAEYRYITNQSSTHHWTLSKTQKAPDLLRKTLYPCADATR